MASNIVALQVIVADAVYRDGQPRSKDRATTLAVLESAISAYRTVLNNALRPEDSRYALEAAYNFEYVVRLRDEVLKGRRRALPIPDGDENLGAEGKSESLEFEREFKQYMPLEEDERPGTRDLELGERGLVEEGHPLAAGPVLGRHGRRPQPGGPAPGLPPVSLSG